MSKARGNVKSQKESKVQLESINEITLGQI